MPSASVAVPMDNRPPSVPDEPKPVKEPRISKRMRKVLTALATKGMTQREAAKQAGMSETYLSTALRKPEIQMFVARAIRQNVAIGALRASSRIVDLIDAGSEHVSLDASKHILAIEGVKPRQDAQVNVNIEQKAGYVIVLTRRADEPSVIDVTPD
jgi:lambda repressor-like predicted transcriptional regulator